MLNNTISDDCNVISVDWGVIANLPYLQAVESLVPSGAYTGDLLRSLMDVAGASLEDFHGIGTVAILAIGIIPRSKTSCKFVKYGNPAP